MEGRSFHEHRNVRRFGRPCDYGATGCPGRWQLDDNRGGEHTVAGSVEEGTVGVARRLGDWSAPQDEVTASRPAKM